MYVLLPSLQDYAHIIIKVTVDYHNRYLHLHIASGNISPSKLLLKLRQIGIFCVYGSVTYLSNNKQYLNSY